MTISSTGGASGPTPMPRRSAPAESSPDDLQLDIRKEFPNAKQVGDFSVTGDPIYKVQGFTRGTPVNLEVVAKGELGLNDMVVEHAPTLEVRGQLGSTPIQGTIERDAMWQKADPKDDFGWAVGDQTHFHTDGGDTDFIITRGYDETVNHVKGQQGGQPVDGSFELKDGGFILAGQMPPQTVDTLTALGDFLTPLKNYVRPNRTDE